MVWFRWISVQPPSGAQNDSDYFFQTATSAVPLSQRPDGTRASRVPPRAGRGGVSPGIDDAFQKSTARASTQDGSSSRRNTIKTIIPLLVEKARTNLATQFPAERVAEIVQLCLDRECLEATPAPEFIDLFVPG